MGQNGVAWFGVGKKSRKKVRKREDKEGKIKQRKENKK